MAEGLYYHENGLEDVNHDCFGCFMPMRTLIILGGARPSERLIASQLEWAEKVIAADRGVDCLVAMGCEPDVLVGDFDSVKSPISKLRCLVDHSSDQFSTDFEKALLHAPDLRTLHILGGLGERTDHLLTNLLIAGGIDPIAEIVFLADREAIHRITPQQALQGTLPPRATISLLPFSRCTGVASKGLRWDLADIDMGIGLQLGQSNVVESEDVEISIKSGVLYVCINMEVAP